MSRSPNPRSSSPSLAAVFTLVALLLGGCVGKDDPGVAITKAEASLVFGVKPPPEAVAPAALPIGEELAPGAASGGFDVFRPPPSQVDLSPSPTVEGPKECPTAPPTAVAERPSDIQVTNPPDVGLYKWRREGTILVGGKQTKLTGFEKRVVRNYKKLSDTSFQFEMVQTRIDQPVVVVSTIEVNSAALNYDTSPGGSSVVSGPRVGDPERGVTLVKLEELNREGQVQKTFAPTTGLLLLPIPVQTGEQFQSAAVDSRSGQTIAHRSTVLRRQRIDACGEVVDGWLVEAERSDSAMGGSLRYSFVIAPQYGGVIINERFQSGSGDTGSDFSFTLGQVRPDPIPAGF